MNNIIYVGLDQKRREFLQKKLTQYLDRLYDLSESEGTRLDAFCKVGIVQILLRDGIVHYDVTRVTLMKLDCKVSVSLFNTTWTIISDYITTGGLFTRQPAGQTVRMR